jgi:ADP-ribose pyrophosphatase
MILERVLSSKILYEGRHFSFKTDVVELPNGRRTTRDIVDHPGAVAIIPILPDGRIVLVRQYRYAVKTDLLEIPAGTLEKGEKPLDCAFRELREETGYEANSMERLMSCYVAPGYSSELIHFYVASALRKAESHMELDEAITVERIEFEQVLNMIKENIIVDAKTVVGMLAYLTCYLLKT